jgi:hypothetical protein
MTQRSALDRLWPLAVLLLTALYMAVAPPILQDEGYHRFVDCRRVFGIPNFWNVVSNLPFAMVGILGLLNLRGISARVIFSGMLLTCFGSAYYHLAPSDARLAYDRLPMTLVFMSLLAHVIAEGWDRRSEARLLVLLAAAGIASALWWRITGDLRPYAIVQFGPLFVLLPRLPSVQNGRFLAAALGCYALAKMAEYYDAAIYSALALSGHAWKHVLAGLASYCIFCWWREESYGRVTRRQMMAMQAGEASVKCLIRDSADAVTSIR